MCDGVWVLFEGSELHSLWNTEEEMTNFMEVQQWVDDPEIHFQWIRLEDA